MGSTLQAVSDLKVLKAILTLKLIRFSHYFYASEMGNYKCMIVLFCSTVNTTGFVVNCDNLRRGFTG